MAEELGLDAKLARRAGLLHDIGKALDHDMEGTHVEIGVEILKKYKENCTKCEQTIRECEIIINKIITKAFLDYNDDIKCDDELTRAFEDFWKH